MTTVQLFRLSKITGAFIKEYMVGPYSVRSAAKKFLQFLTFVRDFSFGNNLLLSLNHVRAAPTLQLRCLTQNKNYENT